MGGAAPRPDAYPDNVGSAVVTSLRLALGSARVEDRDANWPVVFATASRELLASLGWARSGRFIRRYAGPEVVAEWRRAALATHLHGQRQLELLRGVIDAFETSGVGATVLKGLPLGERLYGDAFARGSADIDLHVPAAERPRAAAALRSLGWTHVDGAAPWHEAWSQRCDDAEFHLELHSSLVSDHLVHLPVPRPEVARDRVADVPVPTHVGPLVAPYLAAHLALHQMPPLLWLVDFATLWGGLGPAERDAAACAAVDAGLARYLEWARERAILVERAADGDGLALRALGIEHEHRYDGHSIWRHLALAETLRDKLRVIAAFIAPHRLRGSVRELTRYTVARVRTRLASLAGVSRAYDSQASAVDAGWGGLRPLRVERAAMVSLIREVTYGGGALRVRAPGSSMLPTIPRGSLVRIGPVPSEGITKGDVVLALTADGEPVLHRAIEVGSDSIVTRGDAALAADPPTPLSRVIGTATHVGDGITERPLGRSPRRSIAVSALNLRRRIARAVRGGW
jgi:hypothetical protein